MDPKQETGINSDSASLSATGRSVFNNPQNRFRDTNPNGDIIIPADKGSTTPRPRTGSGGLSGLLNNKPLIIGIAVVLVLAVVAIVLAVTLPKGSGESSGNSASSNYTNDFYRYANYLLYGESTTNALEGEYSLSTNYAVDTALAENDITFFETAKGYYDNFLDTYASDESRASLAGAIDEYTAVFDFVYRYATTELLSDDNIVEKYFELGLSGLNDYLSEEYAQLSGSSYESGKAYADAKVAYDRMLVNMVTIYENNGCFSNGGIDETCVASIQHDGGDYQDVVNSDDLSLIDGAINDVKSLCWKISAILDGDPSYTDEINEADLEDDNVEGEE